MKVVNDISWAEFEVGSLLRIIPGKGCTKKEINEHPGDLEVVQSTGVNNSITGLISKDYCLERDYLISEGPCLTVVGTGQGAVGYVTYHPGPVVVGNNAKLLLPNLDLDENQMLFLATVLNVLRERFSYSDIVSIRRYSQMVIQLPVNGAGDPDWEYMKQTMCRVIRDQEDKLHLVNELANSKSKTVDINTWKQFRIEDIFDIHSTLSGIDKDKLNQIPGDIPYVTRSGGNNAVSMYVTDDQDPKYRKESGNVITVGLDTQTVCYQPIPFYTGQNVHTIAHEKFNVYNALFVVTCIKAVLRKYDWANGATLGRLKKDFVNLPVNADGDPDWEYMESTMKTLLEQQVADLDILEQLLPPPEVVEVI